jgi:hypothetical protein
MTSPGRPVRIVRTCRIVAAAALLPNLVTGTADALTGSASVFIALAAIMFLAGCIAFQTRAIRRMEKQAGRRYLLAEPVLRKVTGRPVMTGADRRHLQEMERGLGWESPEMPAPAMAVTAKTAPAVLQVRACGRCGENRAIPVSLPGGAFPVAWYCTKCGRKSEQERLHRWLDEERWDR